MHSQTHGAQLGINPMGEVFLPSTYDFFSPFASQKYLESVCLTGADHTRSVTVTVNGAVTPAFTRYTGQGSHTITPSGNVQRFLQPREGKHQILENVQANWDQYVARMDTLARYPIDFAAPKLAMLRPLVSADTQWRVPPLLPYYNLHNYYNRNVPLPNIIPGIIHIESLDSIAKKMSVPNSIIKKNIRLYDSSILRKVGDWFEIPHARAMAFIILTLFGYEDNGYSKYTYVDVSTTDAYDLTIADDYQVVAEDVVFAFKYLCMSLPLEDQLLGCYLYPFFGGIVLHYRDQVANNTVPLVNIREIVTPPAYDFMDHVVVHNRHGTDLMVSPEAVSNTLCAIKILAKQMARYLAGLAPLPTVTEWNYRDINMDLTIQFRFDGWTATHGLDYQPYELIYVFGGTARDLQQFINFDRLSSGDIPTKRFEPTYMSSGDGMTTNLLCLLPQGNAKNTTLAAASAFLPNRVGLAYWSQTGAPIIITYRSDRCTRFVPSSYNIDTNLQFESRGILLNIGQNRPMWNFSRMPVLYSTREVLTSYNPLA